MIAHTNARLIRVGHRVIATEHGLPLFEVFSGAIGTAEADANEERLVTAWNTHDQLLTALNALSVAVDNLDPQSGVPIGYQALLDAAAIAEFAIAKATGAAP